MTMITFRHKKHLVRVWKMFCFGFTGSTQTGQVIVLTFLPKYRFLTADCPDVSSETLSLVTTSLEQLKISSGFTLVKHKC